MSEPKIVTEAVLNAMHIDEVAGFDIEHTIRIFAAALEGQWHDDGCERGIPMGEKMQTWTTPCGCNARLLEQYHAC